MMETSPDLEILEAEYLKLSHADRLHLMERLIGSLDNDPEIEVAWEQEADKREAELAVGAVAEISGGEAMARLQARLVR